MFKLAQLSKVAAIVGLAGIAAGAALGADMRVKAPAYKAPSPVIVAYSWTGCYIGGHVGGLWATKEWSNVVGTSLGSHDADGWLGGVQGGCDYQFAGGFIIGIQGDYAWTDAEGSNVNPIIAAFTQHSKIKSLATVTGRIGYAWDRFLGYVKGGGAWERDHYELFDNVNADLFTASETRSGWTVGVGGEYAFTNFLSGFVEYNYYDFGSRENIFDPGAAFTINIKERKSVVKAGLNLRFGGWVAPVTAKY